MRWVQIGVRKQSIYDKSLKILAWSESLKRELGWGYQEFITTKPGDQFVNVADENKILKLAQKLNNFDKYAKLTKDADELILKLLHSRRINYLKIMEIQSTQLAYFLIARMIADRIYTRANKTLKKNIESWRNDKTLFSHEEKVIKSLASYLNLSVKTLNHIMASEINLALETGNLEKLEIAKRFNKQWSLVLHDKKIELYFKDLTPVLQKINVNEIKGKVAFNSGEVIKGIVGQDILVVAMTTPDMVPKMKKMKAVITDEGGILSHAAITAREFKIPTIIGTKIGTQILKNGDLVEVDANNGVVKVINQE